MTIWIIETETALRILLSTNLKIRGYHAVPMEHIGLVSLDTTPPDMIFLDLLYDDETADGFLSELADHPTFCKVPVIVTTTMHQKPDLRHPNIKHILLKPYGIDEFFTVFLQAIT